MAQRIAEKNERGYTRVKDGAGRELGTIEKGKRFPEFIAAGDVVIKPNGAKEEVIKVDYIEAEDCFIVVSKGVAE